MVSRRDGSLLITFLYCDRKVVRRETIWTDEVTSVVQFNAVLYIQRQRTRTESQAGPQTGRFRSENTWGYVRMYSVEVHHRRNVCTVGEVGPILRSKHYGSK